MHRNHSASLGSHEGLREDRARDQGQFKKACCDFAAAIAYVPWQRWQLPYEPKVGLRSGTMFPALNKPFYPRGGV